MGLHLRRSLSGAGRRRGARAALSNAEMFNLHLLEISKVVAPGAHAVVILDGAGYHGAGKVEVPDNFTLIKLPPYSPELNSIENVWEYLRKNKLANSVWNT
jgi:transposase